MVTTAQSAALTGATPTNMDSTAFARTTDVNTVTTTWGRSASSAITFQCMLGRFVFP